jgi:benzodiazapine receptor
VAYWLVQKNNSWFETLKKPTWNPPGYLFAPVWIMLYLLMGISLGIIWNYNLSNQNKRRSYFLFGFQLLLNFCWSILFFKINSTIFALVDIILMLIVIFLTIESFSKYSKLAAWLLTPYLVWVSFATILNLAIWDLNR